MTRDAVLALLSESCVRFAPTGSRYICDPAPSDTDEDYVCLERLDTPAALLNAGFEANTDDDLYEDAPEFYSWRLGEFNVITTNDEGFYQRFVEATEEAKRLNLLDKDERIALFQRKLYDVYVEDVLA